MYFATGARPAPVLPLSPQSPNSRNGYPQVMGGCCAGPDTLALCLYGSLSYTF